MSQSPKPRTQKFRQPLIIRHSAPASLPSEFDRRFDMAAHSPESLRGISSQQEPRDVLGAQRATRKPITNPFARCSNVDLFEVGHIISSQVDAPILAQSSETQLSNTPNDTRPVRVWPWAPQRLIECTTDHELASLLVYTHRVELDVVRQRNGPATLVPVCGDEPPRLSRRLQPLRGWSDEEVGTLLT